MNFLDVLNIVRFGLGSVFLFLGLLIIILAVIGVYRLGYILNRMHVAATCDTMGIFLMLVGLVLIEGFTFTTIKLALIIIFFWITSPICSHLISKAEANTNEDIDLECEEVKL